MKLEEYQKHSLSLRKLKRSWRICPRCQKHAVNKNYRKCMACGGRLFWDGDDAKEALINHDAFYVWHKSIFGLIGWYEMSFFGVDFLNNPMPDENDINKQFRASQLTG